MHGPSIEMLLGNEEEPAIVNVLLEKVTNGPSNVRVRDVKAVVLEVFETAEYVEAFQDKAEVV